MESLRCYLACAFEVTSEEWEIQQQSLVATAMMRGDHVSREYPVTGAASNKLEKAFFTSVAAAVQSHSIWSIIPEDELTVEFRCLAFRIQNRIACFIELRLAHEHRLLPVAAFALWNDASASASIKERNDCELDEWTAAFIDSYPSLEGPDMLADLECHAIEFPMNTSKLECLHALVRRFLVGRSVQTTRLLFSHLSGATVHSKEHSRLDKTKPLPETHKATVKQRKGHQAKAGSTARQKQTRRKTAKFGGPWRLYVR